MINKNTISFPFDDSDLQSVIAYDVNNRPQYVGRAPAGVATTVAQWQIRKITYDGTTGLPLTVQFANGSNDYNSIWTGRAGYTYA